MRTATLRLMPMVMLLALQPILAPLASWSPDQLGNGGASDQDGAWSSQGIQSYTYQRLKISTALWEDGRGDVIVEQRLLNQNITNWTSTSWYFNWYPGNYSNIRAWDDQGPLTISSTQSGTRVDVAVYFRQPVPVGAAYHFFLAITIGNMAGGSGNDWQANWYWSPGQSVQEFIQGVTFPSNSTILSANPTPTYRHLTYLEWREANTPPGWQQTIDVDYRLSSTITVPLYRQTSSPWNNDPYGRYPPNDPINTVAKWGCHMTSAAMIVSYWGQKSSPPRATDPRALNTWLRNHNGYDENNGVIHSKIAEYATSLGVALYNRGYYAGRNDAVLDDYLRSGNPVIIGVNKRVDPGTGRTYASHFVVATGKTTVNGVRGRFL